MKIKNIMFSGVMAAILMTVAGNASAADVVSVASTGYVDAKVEGVETNITNNYVSNTQLAEKVTTVIESAESGKLSQIDDVVSLVGDETSGLVADVNALQDKVGDKAVSEQIDEKVGEMKDAEGNAYTTVVDYVTAKTTGIATDAALGELQGKVTDAENAIDVLKGGVDTDGSVAKTIADALNNGEYIDKTELEAYGYQNEDAVDTAIDAKITELNLGETYQEKLTEAQIAAVNSGIDVDKVTAYQAATDAVNNADNGLAKTYEIASGAAGKASDNGDAIAKLNSDASVDGSVAHTVESYAVPKPGENCSKTTCVLTVDQATNKPYWMELALTVQP